MSSTSGRIQSGSANFSYFYFQWQLVFQDTPSNYSHINWQWGLNTSNSAFWGSNAVKSVSGYINGGLAFGANTWSGISGNGDHQLLSGSWDIGHNSDGTKNFGMSSTGFLISNGNFSNSGSWDLPNIPRAATLSALSMDGGGIPATDEGPMWVEFANPAGSNVQVFIDSLDTSTRIYTSGYVGSRHNVDFSGGTLTAALQNAIPNSNTGTIRIGIYDASFGSYDYRDRSYSIKNDTGQANPTFSTVAYHDSNSTTATLTGNNQFIVQNASTLNIDIASGNKATSNKGASMVSYTASINAVPTNVSYTTSTINAALGAVDASSDQIMSVTATDSRGNTTTVNKTVTMVPYLVPTVTAIGEREDGFGADTTIDITAGYSTVTVSGTPKNSVNNSTGIGYKVWAVGDSEPGSYTLVPSTYSGGNVTITSDPVETLDQDTSFNLKVRVTDALNTTVYTTLIGIGKAAFRIGADGNVYNENKQLIPAEDMFPVGAILITSVNSNPSSYMPGSWSSTTTASQSLFGQTLYGWERDS
jgi:hypothetical protein